MYHSAGYDIHALDAETGTERWAFHVGARVYGSPAISADGRTLYFGSYPKKGLHAIRVQAATCSLDASNVVLPARASGLGTCDGLSELSVRDPRGMPYIAASPPGYCSDWQYPDGPGPEYDDLTSTPEACLARCLAQVPGATSFSLRGTQCLCSATTKGTCPIITTHTVKTYRAFRVRGPTTCLPTCAPGFAGRGSVSCDGDTGRVVNTFRCVSDGIKHQERWVWGRTGWSCDDTCRGILAARRQDMLDTARMEPSAFFNGVVPEAARAVCTKLTAGGDAKWAPYRWVDPKTSTFQLGECWTNSPTASARSTCGYAPSQHFESFSSPDPNAIRTSVSRLCPCKAPMGGVTEGIVKWSGQLATACWDPAEPGRRYCVCHCPLWTGAATSGMKIQRTAGTRAADGVQLWKYHSGFLGRTVYIGRQSSRKANLWSAATVLPSTSAATKTSVCMPCVGLGRFKTVDIRDRKLGAQQTHRHTRPMRDLVHGSGSELQSEQWILAWNSPYSAPALRGNPVVSHDDTVVYITSVHNYMVHAVNAADGTSKWTRQPRTPVVVDLHSPVLSPTECASRVRLSSNPVQDPHLGRPDTLPAGVWPQLSLSSTLLNIQPTAQGDSHWSLGTWEVVTRHAKEVACQEDMLHRQGRRRFTNPDFGSCGSDTVFGLQRIRLVYPFSMVGRP